MTAKSQLLGWGILVYVARLTQPKSERRRDDKARHGPGLGNLAATGIAVTRAGYARSAKVADSRVTNATRSSGPEVAAV